MLYKKKLEFLKLIKYIKNSYKNIFKYFKKREKCYSTYHTVDLATVQLQYSIRIVGLLSTVHPLHGDRAARVRCRTDVPSG